MWGKLILGGAAILAASLVAFLGNRLIVAYGAARYQAGFAEGQVRQMPAILASRNAATQAAVGARDRVIAADARHMTELARITESARQSDKDFHAYQATVDGRADCLGAERVRAIAASRANLFPAAFAAAGDGPRPVPSEAAADTAGRGNE